MIHFACACGRQLQADESLIGTPARCPICNDVQTVPDPAAVPPSDRPGRAGPEPPRPLPVARTPYELSRRRRVAFGALVRSMVIASLVVAGMWALAVVFLPDRSGLPTASGRTQSANNLHQMAIAINTYVMANNGQPGNNKDQFPPIGGGKHASDGGKSIHPNLSWRVTILPYIEEDNLYYAMHLDEPWDSPHNLTLLPRMPKTYVLPGASDPPGLTRYRAISGKCAAFEPLVPGAALPAGRLLADFPKGAGKTIFIVEAAEAVPWTKPAELVYAPELPLPRLRDGCQCVMGDASIATIKPGTPEAELRGLMDRTAPSAAGRIPGRPTIAGIPRVAEGTSHDSLHLCVRPAVAGRRELDRYAGPVPDVLHGAGGSRTVDVFTTRAAGDCSAGTSPPAARRGACGESGAATTI